jgi:hypothetical protein
MKGATGMSILRTTQARWLAGTTAAAAVVATALVGLSQLPATAAAPVPEVFAGFDNSDQLVGTSPRTNTINVPAGAYAITAKAFVTQDGVNISRVNCRLTAGGNFDESTTSTFGSNSSEALALNLVHTTTVPRAITLSCRNLTSSPTTTMSFIKIVATRVNAVSDVSM